MAGSAILNSAFTEDMAATILAGLRRAAKDVAARYIDAGAHEAFIHGLYSGIDEVTKATNKCLKNSKKIKDFCRYLKGYDSENFKHMDFKNPTRVFHYGKGRTFYQTRVVLNSILYRLQKEEDNKP